MIDIHTHIVFCVDDGSESINQSLEILNEAKKAGFDKIIATPHYIEDYYNCDKNQIQAKIKELQEKQNDVQIFQGNEIYINDKINELIKQEKISTLNNTRYVLFELPLNAEALNLKQVVYALLENEKVPILAHPERYPFVQENPNELIQLIEIGVLMQSNYGSILGQYGNKCKKTIKKLLKNNMVHLLGSDVHKPGSIYYHIEESLRKIKKIVGDEDIELITTTNAEKILGDKDINIKQPIYIK